MEYPIKKYPKKILVLISQLETFRFVQSALNHAGFEWTENPDDVAQSDLAVLDEFYLKAGAKNFIEAHKPSVASLLILNEKEVAPFWASVDEVFFLRTYQSSASLREAFLSTLNEKFDLTRGKLTYQEFGRGLWFSMLAGVPA